MQMHLSSDVRIPDGLLAANALLAENSRQGSWTYSGTVHQSFEVAISSTSLGISNPLYDTRVESRYTGKERDTESGLDYFGARYYVSNMGRFMSPDWAAKAEPVPYAKLENPQTLNLYAYVGNNPLSRTDPTGHYVCSGSKDQCAAIQTGLNLAKAAQDKLGADSKGGKAIGAVLKFYGAAGEKNGVNVSFGNLNGPTGTASRGADGQINLKFDLGAISASAKGSMPGTSITERAGTEIHEGTHGIDERAMGHNPENRHEEMGTERNAYRTESYVYQGLGVNTPSGLWSESWSAGTAEQNRNAGVEAGAKASTDYVCKNGCQP
jgi:RHS repeat-associated protein